jgi:F-type H+-transporting ATPase subunit gamma
MPSLIDLRRRIRAVKSTQQITKAMKMIAASRLKRAQDRVIAARPFAQRMLKVLNGLVSRVDQDAHPLLRIPAQGTGRPLLIVITADRGLCGSFNSNVIKAAGQFILNEAPGRDIALGLVGRKGRDFFRRRGFDIRYEAIGIFQKMTFAEAIDIADAAIEDFTSGKASSVYLVYNEFKSVMTQRIVVERLLPIPRLESEAAATAGPSVDYIYEPAPEEIFRDLLPRHVQTQVYRALLESNAAFFAAQMTAMDTATKNSADMIASLTLYMNKVRQAAITREIIEVVSGAQAS